MTIAKTSAPGLVVRTARPDERAGLEGIQRRASLVSDSWRDALLAHPDAIYLDEADIVDGSVLVAEYAGTVVGFAVILRRTSSACELDGLFVEPERWRQGIGKTLVQQAEKLASHRGASAMIVIAGNEAQGFYEALGFVATDEVQTRFGTAIAMRKRLPGA